MSWQAERAKQRTPQENLQSHSNYTCYIVYHMARKFYMEFNFTVLWLVAEQ